MRRLAATYGFLRSMLIYHNPRALLRWREFYRQLLRPGDLAFDVGAHVGNRARAMRAASMATVAEFVPKWAWTWPTPSSASQRATTSASAK